MMFKVLELVRGLFCAVSSANTVSAFGNSEWFAFSVPNKSKAATVGTRVTVEVRGTDHPATVVALPFYRRESGER